MTNKLPSVLKSCPGYATNFTTLAKAFAAKDVALVECTCKQTGKPVIVIAAINRHKDKSITITPLAKMFDNNPYEELIPPNVEEKPQVTEN